MSFSYTDKDGVTKSSTVFNPTATSHPVASSLKQGLNTWGQLYEIHMDCYKLADLSKFESLLPNLINCTPHAINYFYGYCRGSGSRGATPAFRINAGEDSFYNRFRPESKSSLQKYGLPIRIYNQNSYTPLQPGTAEHQLLYDFFRMINPQTILIMSVIGANYIIGAIENGLITPNPRLMIISPNSGDSVRDTEGNMIGVISFTVIYNDGKKVPREQ